MIDDNTHNQINPDSFSNSGQEDKSSLKNSFKKFIKYVICIFLVFEIGRASCRERV